MRKKIRIAAIGCLLAVASLITSVSASIPRSALTAVTTDPAALYNGIVYPEDYVFSGKNLNGQRQTPPYLLSAEKGGYHPDVVNIDVGRQLFVDDFLIDSTTLTQTYHRAKTYDAPVFSYENTKVQNGTPATSGGIWFDMDEKLYKMWYGVGFFGNLGYATSTDGVNWEIPDLNGKGSNVVYPSNVDSYSIWIDYDAPKKTERYKMMVRYKDHDVDGDGVNEVRIPAELFTSATGKTWVKRGETGPLGDRSTFFQNAFTKEWVFSIRDIKTQSAWGSNVANRRTRYYNASTDWMEAAKWNWTDDLPTFWQKTDASDLRDSTQYGNKIPQLYNFDSIGYESVMLGMFQIWYGPDNDICSSQQTPKITELQACYSRDGFHYERPVQGVGNAFIGASRTKGTWDYGYVQSATGGLIVYDDEIRIYYTAFSGEYNDGKILHKGMHNGGAIGIASLRRDGFASMDGTGELTTVPLTVTKQVKYLFVNAKNEAGSLRAEILDLNGNVVEGYSAAECNVMSADDCCYRLSWNGSDDLSFLRGKGFRIRFVQTNGELYSFWLSADPEGASGGAMGAGYAGVKELNPDLPEDPLGEQTGATDGIDSEKKGCRSAAVPGLPVVCMMAVGAMLLKEKKRKWAKRDCITAS